MYECAIVRVCMFVCVVSRWVEFSVESNQFASPERKNLDFILDQLDLIDFQPFHGIANRLWSSHFDKKS